MPPAASAVADNRTAPTVIGSPRNDEDGESRATAAATTNRSQGESLPQQLDGRRLNAISRAGYSESTMKPVMQQIINAHGPNRHKNDHGKDTIYHRGHAKYNASETSSPVRDIPYVTSTLAKRPGVPSAAPWDFACTAMTTCSICRVDFPNPPRTRSTRMYMTARHLLTIISLW